jgi:hypothetical protein
MAARYDGSTWGADGAPADGAPVDKAPSDVTSVAGDGGDGRGVTQEKGGSSKSSGRSPERVGNNGGGTGAFRTGRDGKSGKGNKSFFIFTADLPLCVNRQGTWLKKPLWQSQPGISPYGTRYSTIKHTMTANGYNMLSPLTHMTNLPTVIGTFLTRLRSSRLIPDIRCRANKAIDGIKTWWQKSPPSHSVHINRILLSTSNAERRQILYECVTSDPPASCWLHLPRQIWREMPLTLNDCPLFGQASERLWRHQPERIGEIMSFWIEQSHPSLQPDEVVRGLVWSHLLRWFVRLPARSRAVFLDHLQEYFFVFGEPEFLSAFTFLFTETPLDAFHRRLIAQNIQQVLRTRLELEKKPERRRGIWEFLLAAIDAEGLPSLLALIQREMWGAPATFPATVTAVAEKLLDVLSSETDSLKSMEITTILLGLRRFLPPRYIEEQYLCRRRSSLSESITPHKCHQIGLEVLGFFLFPT